MNDEGHVRAVTLLFLAVLAGCKDQGPPSPPPPRLSAEQRASADQKIADAEKRADELDETHRTLAMQSPPSAAPRPDLGTCPVPFSTLVPEDPDSAETQNGKKALVAKRQTRVLRMTDFHHASRKLEAKGPAMRELDVVLEPWPEKLSQPLYPSQTPEKVLAALDEDIQKWQGGYDLSLVATVLEAPKMATDKTFDSGVVEGTLYVFTRDKGEYVCAASVRDQSSDTVKFRVDSSPTLALLGDFLIEPVLRASQRLVVAGKPPRPAGSASARPASSRR